MTGKFVAVAIVAAIGFSGAAQAADYYAPRQPYTVHQPLNAHSWAGPYLGVNLGYNWGSISNNLTKPSGFSGGAQGGYNWQSGSLVFGLEADIQANAADDTFASWKFSNPWFGTARGRIGYAFDTVMIYGTGGLAFGGLRGESYNSLSETRTSAGWTLGAGAELAVSQNWSAKVEYLYINLSDRRFSVTGLPNGYQFGLIRFGLNYHF